MAEKKEQKTIEGTTEKQCQVCNQIKDSKEDFRKSSDLVCNDCRKREMIATQTKIIELEDMVCSNFDVVKFVPAQKDVKADDEDCIELTLKVTIRKVELPRFSGDQ